MQKGSFYFRVIGGEAIWVLCFRTRLDKYDNNNNIIIMLLFKLEVEVLTVSNLLL